MAPRNQNENDKEVEPVPGRSSSAAQNTWANMLQAQMEGGLVGPSDIKVFLLGNKVLGVHKDLFIMASPVFEDLLNRSMALLSDLQNQSKFSVRLEMELPVFKVMKQFIYANDISHVHIDLTTTLKVLEASVLYQVDRLQPLASRMTMRKITPAGVFEILETARRLELVDLEKQALDYIWNHAEECLQTEKFYELGSYDVCRILSSDELQCEEDQVLKSAIGWVKNKATSGTDMSLQRYFREISHCVRFPFIPLATVAMETAMTPILDMNDLAKLFQNLCLPEDSKYLVPVKYEKRPRKFNKKVSDESEMLSRLTLDDDIVLPPPATPVSIMTSNEDGEQGTTSSANEERPTTPIYMNLYL